MNTAPGRRAAVKFSGTYTIIIDEATSDEETQDAAIESLVRTVGRGLEKCLVIDRPGTSDATVTERDV